MKKKKLYLQILVCLVIGFTALYGSRFGRPTFVTYMESVKTVMMTPLTREDIDLAWNHAIATLSDAPSKLVSAVIAVNEASKYGVPIDEKSTTRLKQVHAAAGGMVLKSGKNEAYGLYVQIQHEDGVSIYGNLSEVNVVESERVQRGEIIGSYDSLSETEFYYELKENL